MRNADTSPRCAIERKVINYTILDALLEANPCPAFSKCSFLCNAKCLFCRSHAAKIVY